MTDEQNNLETAWVPEIGAISHGEPITNTTETSPMIAQAGQEISAENPFPNIKPSELLQSNAEDQKISAVATGPEASIVPDSKETEAVEDFILSTKEAELASQKEIPAEMPFEKPTTETAQPQGPNISFETPQELQDTKEQIAGFGGAHDDYPASGYGKNESSSAAFSERLGIETPNEIFEEANRKIEDVVASLKEYLDKRDQAKIERKARMESFESDLEKFKAMKKEEIAAKEKQTHQLIEAEKKAEQKEERHDEMARALLARVENDGPEPRH